MGVWLTLIIAICKVMILLVSLKLEHNLCPVIQLPVFLGKYRPLIGFVAYAF